MNTLDKYSENGSNTNVKMKGSKELGVMGLQEYKVYTSLCFKILKKKDSIFNKLSI